MTVTKEALRVLQLRSQAILLRLLSGQPQPKAKVVELATALEQAAELIHQEAKAEHLSRR